MMLFRTTSLVIAGIALGAVGAVFAIRATHQKELTPALRGRAVALNLGCFACHGVDGRGGVADPGARGKFVTGWDGTDVATLAASEREVREWILDGVPARLKDTDLALGRKSLLPMPAYRGRISEPELSDLLVYFRAVSTFDTGISQIAYEGRHEAARLGCFECHGSGGVGGAANPGSFKGHIPAWDGDEYPELVRDENELREWILEGHPKRLWENPAARVFLNRQIVQMPAYRRDISDDRLAKIIAYIQWRRPQAPAAAKTTAKIPAAVVSSSTASSAPSGSPETGRPASPVYRSPQSIGLSPDGKTACVVNYTSSSVSMLDVRSRKVMGEIPVGERPNQAVYSRDGKFLFVSCTWAGRIDVVDISLGRVVRSFKAGDEPCGLVLSADGTRLFVTNVISSSVTIIDVASGETLAEVPVGAQPRFAAETADASRLIVSNGLSPWLSVVDTKAGREVERYDLGRASLLRGIACSSDGHWAFVANLVSHTEVPTVQMERGWINSNGFSVLDLTNHGRRVTLLLDHLLSGAANPTGLVLSPDGKRLYVSLAGIHEIAIVDVPAALELVKATSPDEVEKLEENVEILEQRHIARRVPAGGLGPRSLIVSEATGELLVANYFSDSVTILDAATGQLRATIPLGPTQEMSAWRQGELMTCDARITYQNWISCSSCHQEDATTDGLNWDLSNDGLGNRKNNKSLQDIHDTPPAMWSGVRLDLVDGVGAGERFQGFVPMAVPQKVMSEYLGHPDRAPNPYRNRDPEALARGKRLFTVAGCDLCHPAPVYSDLKFHDLGFGTPEDFRNQFDTPSLRSCYRTAPYLHDGRAPTLRSIFTDHNPNDVHGRTRGFTDQELDDLVAYVRSL